MMELLFRPVLVWLRVWPRVCTCSCWPASTGAGCLPASTWCLLASTSPGFGGPIWIGICCLDTDILLSTFTWPKLLVVVVVVVGGVRVVAWARVVEGCE